MSRGGVRRILAHAMDVRSVLGAVVIVLGLAACSIRPGETPSLPSWPVSAEPLPTATSGTGGQVTCGGRSFPRSGLTQPNGAEDASGPEFDALRASLAKFGSEFPGSSTWTWRLAGRDDTGAIFLARTDAFGSPGWVSTEVAADVTGWRPVSMGQCDPQTVLSAEFGPASWALDPAFPPPTPASVDLHILVWERACSGGSPTTGRMSAPVSESTPSTVTIAIGVRPLGGFQSCPGPPGTPAILRLLEPLGDRTLLDGGHVPPVPPSPAF